MRNCAPAFACASPLFVLLTPTGCFQQLLQLFKQSLALAIQRLNIPSCIPESTRVCPLSPPQRSHAGDVLNPLQLPQAIAFIGEPPHGTV